MSKDFKEIFDAIFVNRQNYNEIMDQDKIDNFFKINRKLSIKYPKVAQMFNNKIVDKASAVDRWYLAFENSKSIPKWYWDTKQKEKTKKTSLSKKQISFLMEEYQLTEYDINFLYKYHKADVDDVLKSNRHRIE